MTREDDFIWTDPKRCGGVPCFRGTRIFVSILFDYLAAGNTVQDFMDQYPDLDPRLIDGYLRAQSLALQRPAT